MAIIDNKRIKKALVTGPTGIVGVALVEELIAKGVDVYAVIRPDSSRARNLPESDSLHLIECDLSRLASLEENQVLTRQSIDALYHLGWWGGTAGISRNDILLQHNNIRYTIDAAELAGKLGCSVFVGVGSQAEYGRCAGKIGPNTPANPESGYGIAKLAASQMSRIVCSQKRIRHVWTRLFSVYGPHDRPEMLVSFVIHSLLAGEAPMLTSCEQIWDYLYAADAACALHLAANFGKHGAIYCVGSGTGRRLKEYVEIIRDEVDPDLLLGVGERPYSDNQVMNLVADIEALAQDTGFAPEISFEMGIKKTIAWIRQHEFECSQKD